MNKGLKKGIEFFALREAWLGEGGKPVPRELAQSRADVCVQCPWRDDSNDIYSRLAKNVASIVRRQIELKSEMKLEVDGEDRLTICGICWCVLKLKVHVPIKFIEQVTDDETRKAFPSYCWIRRELQQQTKQTK